MTPEEKKLLQDTVNKLDAFLDVYYRTHFIDQDVFANKVYFNNGVYFKDGLSVSLGATTGGKIGLTGDKLGFLGATPVARQAAIAAPTAPGAAYVQAEAASAVAAINSIRVVLNNFGLTS